MKSFPKKYTPLDLRNRSKKYRENNNSEGEKSNIIFTQNTLPSSRKLSYRDFFPIYLKDFFNYKSFLNNSNQSENNTYEQLFITYGSHLENLSSCYTFFSKRNQTLLQIGHDKLKRRIISSNKKFFHTNYKILNSYTSNNHKIYIPDSDLYIYVLEQLRSLREKGRIVKDTKIGYRSFNLQTSIPSEKILRKEEKIPYYILKYFIGTKGEALYIYVEGDIDVCCGDVALFVHPKDKRYNKYIGKNAIIPLCNRLIPIIGDETVNIGENDGIKRVCPCAEEESIQLAKEHGLPTDIYAFNKEGLYTEYIHEKAFIGKDRNKYYSNILKFIGDIGNISESGEKIKKVPYLAETNERLVPYKIDEIIIDLKDEKQKILNQIFDHSINYPSLDEKISKFSEDYETFGGDITYKYNNYENKPDNGYQDDNDINNPNTLTDNTQIEKEYRIKQKIAEELKLSDYLVCNSQVLFGWKMPLIKDEEGNLKFFDIEKDCLSRKQEPLQFCFDFILLSIIRAGILGIKENGNGNIKLCEYNKFYIKILENEKKIEYFVKHLCKITGEKAEYKKFLNMIKNLGEQNNSDLNNISNLIKNSKYLYIEGNRIFTNIKGIINDIIDPDFIEACIPCYLTNEGIEINKHRFFDESEKTKVFKELLIQNLLLGKNITDSLTEFSYDEKNEFLGDKQLTKLQIEQRQRDLFSIYGENPIRLSLLVNKTFDQKEILLNNIFLKQIRNATRLCIQKDFLPNDIEQCLNNQTTEFDDFDVVVLNKLNDLYSNREIVKTYQDYINFFHSFKESIQNTFFSRYLEIQKVHPTKDVQFVCAYFFNFLLTILYPLIPEFVDALQYVSEKKFIQPIKPLKLEKSTNYNMSVLYNTFIKIKQIKIDCNIKQHETCNLFIKSTPTIGDIFAENEQIFKNYFHISEINYLRLHEPNPLGYETFSDDIVTIGIQHGDPESIKEQDSIETLERDIKNLEDKLILLRQRIQILPEGEQRSKTEEEYAKTKEEIENLTIKHSLLSSK